MSEMGSSHTQLIRSASAYNMDEATYDSIPQYLPSRAIELPVYSIYEYLVLRAQSMREEWRNDYMLAKGLHAYYYGARRFIASTRHQNILQTEVSQHQARVTA